MILTIDTEKDGAEEMRRIAAFLTALADQKTGVSSETSSTTEANPDIDSALLNMLDATPETEDPDKKSDSSSSSSSSFEVLPY